MYHHFTWLSNIIDGFTILSVNNYIIIQHIYFENFYVHQFLAIWEINRELDRLTLCPDKSSADEITSKAVKFWLLSAILSTFLLFM